MGLYFVFMMVYLGSLGIIAGTTSPLGQQVSCLVTKLVEDILLDSTLIR